LAPPGKLPIGKLPPPGKLPPCRVVEPVLPLERRTACWTRMVSPDLSPDVICTCSPELTPTVTAVRTALPFTTFSTYVPSDERCSASSGTTSTLASCL